MILTFLVRNQTLTYLDTKLVPRIGSAEYLQLKFKFITSDWVNLRKTIQISSGEYSESYILESDIFDVPTYYTQQGSFDITFLGDRDSQVVPTNVVTVKLSESNRLWTAEPPDPQNSAYLQLIGSVGDLDGLKTSSKSNIVDAINSLVDGGPTVELDTTLSETGKAADAKAVGDALTELESKEETDPTVPEWAKAATKPSYTAEEVGARPADWMPTAAEVGALPATYTPPNQTAEQVGADPAGTAAEAVSVHNTNNGSHADIRLLIDGLTTRLNALANSTDEDLDQMAELVAYIKSNRSLIDSITTSKVNVADIVNNLTTDISNKPLSAAQGVALKELIDALSNSLAGYRTAAAQDVIDSGKVDKVTGKGLSSNDYTDDAKAKVDALAPVATSGSYNDLTDKPTIPDAVTEETVSGWGFTKNTGTYSKPTGGIPKADLANDVKASLGKADTALQEHQSLAAYRTAAAQNIIDSGKQDRLIAGDNITIAADGKTISATGGAEALIVTITDNNGTLSADKSFIEIRDAILAGIPVLVDYGGIGLPLITLAAYALYFGTFQCDSGDVSNGAVIATVIIEITLNDGVNDISASVETLPNPNAITFTGAVTGSYDGSAPLSVKIPTVPTKTSQLTNDSGYLTLATLPKYEGVVE